VRVRGLAFGFCALAAASFGITACGGGGGASGAGVVPAPTSARGHHGSGSGSITHIVLLIQENRTFNNLFAGFPGATSSKTGLELVPNTSGTGYIQKQIALTETPLTDHGNITHLYAAFLTGWDNGKMDSFNLIKRITNGKIEGKAPYQYVNPKGVAPYRTIAKQWGLSDQMFQTQGSDSFTAHQDLIRGGTCISSVYTCENPSSYTISLIDPPTTNAAWGCDSKAGSKTTTINGDLQVSKAGGPAPCSKDFPDYGSGGYDTLRDLLDAKSVSWKYYTPKWKNDTPSALWDAFDVIAPVRYGSEWNTNIVSPETTIFSDITNGTLPAMSWVIPKAENSDHPGYSQKDTGPSWVASVVNAIGQSQYWNSTAVIVVWDDWGGFYDPVAPPTPRDDQGGPGFRVPMLVVSPYAKIGNGSQGGYVSHTVYEFGSIIRFIEDTFNLGRLGTTDQTSTSMGDMFDFNQSPRPFQTIPSTYKREFFVRQRPSDLPVDTE